MTSSTEMPKPVFVLGVTLSFAARHKLSAEDFKMWAGLWASWRLQDVPWAAAFCGGLGDCHTGRGVRGEVLYQTAHCMVPL